MPSAACRAKRKQERLRPVLTYGIDDDATVGSTSMTVQRPIKTSDRVVLGAASRPVPVGVEDA